MASYILIFRIVCISPIPFAFRSFLRHLPAEATSTSLLLVANLTGQRAVGSDGLLVLFHTGTGGHVFL